MSDSCCSYETLITDVKDEDIIEFSQTSIDFEELQQRENEQKKVKYPTYTYCLILRKAALKRKLEHLKKWKEENSMLKLRLQDLQSEELWLMKKLTEVRQEIDQVRKRLRKD